MACTKYSKLYNIPSEPNPLRRRCRRAWKSRCGEGELGWANAKWRRRVGWLKMSRRDVAGAGKRYSEWQPAGDARFSGLSACFGQWAVGCAPLSTTFRGK